MRTLNRRRLLGGLLTAVTVSAALGYAMPAALGQSTPTTSTSDAPLST